MEKKDTWIISAIFLIGVYLWTLPFQHNHLPFGDVDSSTHFNIADYMGQTDKPLVELPFYLSNLYYMDANDGKLWYFPQYHTGAALIQAATGERVVGIYLFFAIMSLLIIITSYVLIKELFGVWAAAISSFWLLFSMRDILWYVLGVYPQVASFGLIPLYLFCMYKYSTSFLEKDKKPQYSVIGALVILMQLFIHPQAIFISALITAIYAALFLIKNKKLPFGIKEFGIAALASLILIVPFFQFFAPEQAGILSFKPELLGTLFSWYGQIESGMSPDYYSFSQMHGIWLAPLAIVGTILLLLRRKNEDLLMLSWLLAFYISTHISIFGLSRSLRFLEIEGHILYPLAAMAVLRLPGLIKLDAQTKNMARLGLAAVLIGAIIFTSAIPAYGFLTTAFAGNTRVTQPQMDLTDWMRDNTEEKESFYIIGPLSLTKKKWLRVLSFRLMDMNAAPEWQLPLKAKDYDYVIFDYSDYSLQQIQGAAELISLQQSELAAFNGTGIVYNKDNIRVYKVAK